jgi:hypothetical protein
MSDNLLQTVDETIISFVIFIDYSSTKSISVNII